MTNLIVQITVGYEDVLFDFLGPNITECTNLGDYFLSAFGEDILIESLFGGKEEFEKFLKDEFGVLDEVSSRYYLCKYWHSHDYNLDFDCWDDDEGIEIIRPLEDLNDVLSM